LTRGKELSFEEKASDPRPEARLAAVAEALKPGAPRPLAEAVAPLLDDPDHSVRQLAVVLLGQIGNPGVPSLARALADEQPALIRAFAASGLAQAGPGAAPAAEALGRCLACPEESVRIPAALALSRIGTPALPFLRRAMSAKEAATAALGARAVGWMGREGSPAVDDLRRLSATAGEPRVAALAALVAVTGDASKGLPPLISIVRGSDRTLRRDAIDRLGELRELASGAVPTLRRCLEDSAAPVRSSAALALARIGSLEAETREALTRLRRDPDPEARASVAMALTPFGTAALETLHELVGDTDARVAAIAMAGLHAIETRAESKESAGR
jgi:HEAT repeat protein